MIPNSNYAFFYCTFFCTIFWKVGKLFSRNWCVSASLKFYYEKFLINSSISQKNREKKVPQIPQSLKFPLIVKRTYVLYIWEICSFDYWILYFLYKKGNVCKYIYILISFLNWDDIWEESEFLKTLKWPFTLKISTVFVNYILINYII